MTVEYHTRYSQAGLGIGKGKFVISSVEQMAIAPIANANQTEVTQRKKSTTCGVW